MFFGFAGAHRTGKTTLAKELSSSLALHFHDAGVSRIMREFGINAVGDIPIAQRLEAQEFLLKRYTEELDKLPPYAIVDRTPLDMIGYTLGEITMHNCSPELGERADKLVQAYLVATVRFFDTVFILRPLDHYQADPKSPPPNRAYQDQLQFIIEGAAQQVKACLRVRLINTADRTSRFNQAHEAIYRRSAELDVQARTRRFL